MKWGLSNNEQHLSEHNDVAQTIFKAKENKSCQDANIPK